MKYDVTIGIPVYRAEAFIRRTLESAFSQTYPSIEFLLIDDGSGDGTSDLIRQIADSHPRGGDLRLITLPENQGVSEARNRILDEARGDYLYFMDSDDVIRPDTIELMMRHARDFGADVVFGSIEKISPEGERILYQYPCLSFEAPDAFANYAYRRYAGIQASACNFLMRLEQVQRGGLCFYRSNYWEDMVFVLDLVTMVQRAVLLPDLTYSYLCRQNSLSNFQERDHIDKAEILRNVGVAAYMKEGCARLRQKPYYPMRCYVAVMTDFYIACHVLKRRRDIRPAVTNREIRDYLAHPASLRDILSFRQARLANLALYLLGHLPPALSVAAIRMAGKAKHLI